MRTDRERLRATPYPKGKPPRKKKHHKEASLGFCWCFGAVVCLTFGLASFLMFSAWGHFSFSSSGAAWGSDNEDNLITSNLIKVEITELEATNFQNAFENESEELYLTARNSIMEEFGPLPKYLSDYESIILSVQEDGTKLPEDAEEDEEEIAQDNKIQEPILAENGPSWREHVVQAGETLSDIAMAYGGVTAQDILRANGLKDANRLSANQLLLIPNDPRKIEDTLDEVRTRQMRVAATKEKVEPLKISAYVVVQGDSLWSISNSQNIELDTLVGSNTFKTSAKLRPGAVLRIPNQDGIFYVMKKGDAIEAVCKRYGVSVNKLRLVNPTVELASLKTGDEIFLPGARPEGLVEVAEVKKTENKKNISTQTVKNTKTVASKNEKPVLTTNETIKSSSTYKWPVMGRINSPFGWRQHPITKRRDFHTGIDIKADRGTPIKGAGSGRVVYSGWMGGYGKVLVIEHSNGQSTLYAHCSTLLVGKGSGVSQGQVVAKVGTTGRSTGPHLHFEVRNGNSPVNPIKYLR